ncbi:hypothetical protein EZS27_044384, partial [termite gut metagenome]
LGINMRLKKVFSFINSVVDYSGKDKEIFFLSKHYRFYTESTFITPFDREDINALGEELDNVVERCALADTICGKRIENDEEKP